MNQLTTTHPDREEIAAIRCKAMEFAGIGLYRHALNGTVLFMDRNARRILDLPEQPEPSNGPGCGPDPVIGAKITELMDVRASSGSETPGDVRSIGHVCDLDVAFMTLSGKLRWVQHDSYLVEDRQTGQEAIQVVIRDITARREAQEKVRLWAKVFEASGEGILILDADGRIADVNNAYAELTGFGTAGIVGEKPDVLSARVGGKPVFDQVLDGAREQGRWQGEVWCRRKSGAIFPLSMSLSAIRGDSGSIAHFVGIVYDITQAKRAAHRLERLAHYDILTGLPNRALFRDRLEQAMVQATRRRERVAMFFLDLDNFKSVNDSLGHAAGDTLLMLVAERLKKAVRQSDTLSRLAGDEFTVVLTDSQDISQVTEVASRMLESLARPFTIEGESVLTSASIGIALFPADSENPDELMAKADIAMYRAKEGGRNRFCLYGAGMDPPEG